MNVYYSKSIKIYTNNHTSSHYQKKTRFAKKYIRANIDNGKKSLMYFGICNNIREKQ